MQTLELLSPAKNLECGITAINHGADAVYIGASRFGARAAAGNSIDDIRTLCHHAHLFDARVFVTVNTVIYDNEIEETITLCRQLKEAGVDALLIQDMGLTEMLGNEDINLHASTQTDNRTADKVKWLASLGFKRVVLARELSIEEIAEIHKAVPEVELEVFVHGALCVSYSGQCYASEHCFSRSANRGECAQFCRMPFTLKDADGRILEQSRHLLSLKDMAQLENLEKLAEAGAVSFKIEGRLKDADYVKNITAAYSERLNEICRRHPDRYCRASMGHCSYTFTPDIKKSFNRGFTSYFANGRQQNMVSLDTPKALGEMVGKVKELRSNSFNVASTAAFSNGDGLCFFDSNRQLVGFRVNRAEGNRLFPLQMPHGLKPGTILYRNHDQAFQTLLAKPSSERKVQISMALTVKEDQLTLNLTDEHGNTCSVTAPYEYQTAQKPQEENIRKQLTKLGGTIYTCCNVIIDCNAEQPFIPSSMLAQLRREAVEAMENRERSKSAQCANANTGNSITNAPHYKYEYLYNAANRQAKSFYEKKGINAKAFETDTVSDKMLMQCRYCLRNEMGYCTKSNRKAPWKEPLTLMLDDGRQFRVKFNCNECQMEIWA